MKRFIFTVTQRSSFLLTVFERISRVVDLRKLRPSLASLGSRSLLPGRNVLEPTRAHYEEDDENGPTGPLWSPS